MQVVVHDAAIDLDHDSQHEGAEAEQRPGKGIHPFARGEEQQGRENHQQKSHEAHAEFERFVARHPAIGLARGVEMRGHVDRQLVPDLPVLQRDQRQRQPEKYGCEMEDSTMHREPSFRVSKFQGFRVASSQGP